MANIVHCKTDRTINRQIRKDRRETEGEGEIERQKEKTERKRNVSL